MGSFIRAHSAQTNDTWHPSFVGDGRIRYYSLARYALIEALRMAGVRSGHRVLLPAYICRDLLASLHSLGAVPYWYDVTPNLSPTTDSAEWPEADTVLAINYFGFPQDLQPFIEYTHRTGAVIIEDNAHGYLSRDQNAEWLGCRTSLGLFSFRKTLRIPDGAALWAKQTHTGLPLPEQYLFDGAGVNAAQLMKAKLRGLPVLGERAYRLSTALARTLRKLRTGSETPPTDPNSEQLLPSTGNPWSGLLSALSSLAEIAEIERRRAAYLTCEVVGERAGATSVFAALPPYCAPYGYAFRGNTKTLSNMQQHAAENGFDLVTWPDLPTEIAAHSPPHYKDVFFVNFLW